MSAIRGRRYLLPPSAMDVTLSWSRLEAVRSTICAASTCSLTLVRWDIRQAGESAYRNDHCEAGDGQEAHGVWANQPAGIALRRRPNMKSCAGARLEPGAPLVRWRVP